MGPVQQRDLATGTTRNWEVGATADKGYSNNVSLCHNKQCFTVQNYHGKDC